MVIKLKKLSFVKQEMDYVPKSLSKTIKGIMKDHDFRKKASDLVLDAISLGLEEAFDVPFHQKDRVFMNAYYHVMKGGI